MSAGAVSAVGGLLPRDFLDRVLIDDRTLPGMEPADFGLVPGERTRDAITRSWNRLAALWLAFKRSERALPDSDDRATRLTRERWLIPLLNELGFVGLDAVQSLAPDEDAKAYAISHEWRERVPVHLMGWRTPIDRRTPGLPGAAKASPHGLLQEFLNRSDSHLWGIVSNGRVLRLLRDNASLTRQAYTEFDLASIFDGESFADFTLLWLCCHRTRFEGDRPQLCVLEQWHKEAATQGTRAREKLRSGVEQAIVSLGRGAMIHPGNTCLRDRLRNGDLKADSLQRQLLRVVYRMLFLLVAESRGLLLTPTASDTAKDRFHRFYSMQRLCRLARARRGGNHSDLWRSLNATMAAMDIGDAPTQRAARGALGLTSLGSLLWSQHETADLTHAYIDNAHLLEAVRNLAFVYDDEARVRRPVDYQNLGTEELGSIYESLLELHAVADPGTRAFDLGPTAGSERKTTGSYYTPPELISRLLDDALDPVIKDARDKAEPEQALLELKVLDPACGSGHFLIAAAHRIADALASVREGGTEPSPKASRAALREVVSRCLYGIDINPMAVELCKVSLWLESNTPGRPLSFLDHRIVCGNSLLGATPRLVAEGIPNAAFKTLTGDDKEHVSALRRTNKKERKQRSQGLLALDWSPASAGIRLASAVHQIDKSADNTAEEVVAKEEEYARLRSSGPAMKEKLIADAWCAAFVAPKKAGQPAITDNTLRALQARSHEELIATIWSSRQQVETDDYQSATIASILDLADQHQFTHLHLTFPDVFQLPEDPSDAANEHTGWSGGFDAVVGNPPFLNQLRDLTVTDRRVANLQNIRFRGSTSTFTDTAYLFFTLSYQSARPTGGHVGLVQPDSFLAADGAAELRQMIASLASLTFLWVAGEKVFNASVLTCFLVVRVDQPQEPRIIKRSCGANFETLPDLKMSMAELTDAPTWGPLIADGFGVPRVHLKPTSRIGDVLSAAADFRDQYYGLIPYIVEADTNDLKASAHLAPLMTVGLIDPLCNLWGKAETRFAKRPWNAPAVDLVKLRAESDLAEWADRRRVPKLLVATQTPVLEVVPDEKGNMLPSVPVITIVPASISLWHAAALLTSPVLTAWAAARHLGASLNTHAIKLSARQIENLPLPQQSEAWDQAAGHARDAFFCESADKRLMHLHRLAQQMCNAFDIKDPTELIEWWMTRLPKRERK